MVFILVPAYFKTAFNMCGGLGASRQNRPGRGSDRMEKGR